MFFFLRYMQTPPFCRCGWVLLAIYLNLYPLVLLPRPAPPYFMWLVVPVSRRNPHHFSVTYNCEVVQVDGPCSLLHFQPTTLKWTLAHQLKEGILEWCPPQADSRGTVDASPPPLSSPDSPRETVTDCPKWLKTAKLSKSGLALCNATKGEKLLTG